MLSMFGKGWTFRYAFHKLWQHAMQSVEAGGTAARQAQATLGKGRDDAQQSPEMMLKVKEAVQAKVAESFAMPLTQVIKFTGPAMAPLLNRKGTKDPASHEFLLTHKIIDPTASNVLKGDVVAFRHPLGGVERAALMVRRVTAQGGELLESDSAQHTLAPDTVWLTADNEELSPPDVEDSRTFGPVQLGNIVGRCIYAIRSKSDRQHIANNDRWRALDRDVVAVELTDELLDELQSDAA